MVINFIIGKELANEHYENILNGQKVISSLTGSPIQENKSTCWISDYGFVEFDKYIKQYNKLTSGQKIFFILQFLTTNQIEYVYFLSNKPDIEFFKTLLNCWKDEIIIQYFDENDIEEIKNLDAKDNTIIFKKEVTLNGNV